MLIVFKKLIFGMFIALCAKSAFAQPLMPFYIPYAPGGLGDRIGRLLIINNKDYFAVNKPGAGGQIAISEMTKRPGPILITIPGFFVSNTLIYKDSINYDPKNLEVVALLGDSIGVLICKKSLQFTSVNDIINYKNILSFGTSVPGGTEHLNTEVFLDKINRRNDTIINYAAGGNKQILDLLGGHIDCVFGNLTTLLPFLTDEKVTVILSSHQTKLVENVPTWKKQFGTDYPLHNTIAIAVDKRLEDNLKKKIVNDIKNVIDTNEFKKELESLGQTRNITANSNINEEIDIQNKNLFNFLNKNKINLKN